MDISQSYLKVQYDLRPGKQIERRMLLDAFQLLSEDGFRIRTYTYIGMGSIHFYDFAILHRFFGVSSMLSVEIDPRIRKRIEFNNPYRGCIETRIGIAIGDILKEISNDRRYFVWLDYDSILCTAMLDDITQAASILPAGSILLVTVDTERPSSLMSGCRGIPATREETKAYFDGIGVNYKARLDAKFGDLKSYEYENLHSVSIDLIAAAINAGVKHREVTFSPLFNFLYADGHRMLTLGGMICGREDAERLTRSVLRNAVYSRFRLDENPYCIRVPKITRKERFYLDSNMPCDDRWSPDDFEFSEDDINQYREIYRFFPAYAEMLI